MDDSQARPSGIPRPSSRLPMPKTPSTIPRPASTTTPRIPPPSTPSRPTPSRPTPSTTSVAAGGDSLRNPKLRASASRDQLRSSVTVNTNRTQRLRASLSREQLAAHAAKTPTAKPRAPSASQSQSQSQARSVSQLAQTPRRSSALTANTSPKPADPADPADLPADSSHDGDGSDVLFKRRVTLTRRPSETFAASPYHDARDGKSGGAPPGDGASNQDATKARSSKARPSLSERTIETLAQIPSSPAVRKKSSAFFEQSSRRPRSRADSSGSRPGSSYNSDGSGRHSARATSRPASSAGQADPTSLNGRSSASGFRNTLTTINGTPDSGRRPTTTPRHRMVRPRASLSAISIPAAGSAIANNRSPSPEKRSADMLPPKAGSKTISGTRTVKSRASVNGLFKKPSIPAFGQSESSRNVSNNSTQSSAPSWDGTISSVTSSSTKASAGSTEPSTPGSNRKTSAALREQIAKAKAAKRAAAQKADTEPATHEAQSPIIPSDDGFDFGVAHGDPFNTRAGENPGKKVLQQRITTGRTTGRLNIAALGLKEMPAEVLKMYDMESMGANDGSWAESVDVTRLVAADNEFEILGDDIFPDVTPGSAGDDDEGTGNIFGGLETVDLHGNLLINVPRGFRQLAYLTSLNLSSNRLSNDSMETISQMTALRDLKLANNLLFGPLHPDMANLDCLEILDLRGNNVSALPRDLGNMARLRILNLNENSFESLPFDDLAKLPLTELLLRKNKLSGTLIEEPLDALPTMQTLDVSMNQLTRLVPLGAAIGLPEVHTLSLSMNRLQGLPDMTTWTSLLTLTVDENNISSIPNSFTSLEKLRHADFSSNDIRVVPPEIARMDNLGMIRLSGNPLRDKKFVSITTDELKDILAGRLEPPPPYQEPNAQSNTTRGGDAYAGFDEKTNGGGGDPKTPIDDDSRSDDDFTTPPTSALQSPSHSRNHTATSLRSRSQTLSNQTWPVKQGGTLDRSRTDSSSLHPVVCSKVAAEHQVRTVQLHHNLFSCMPTSLSFFAATLSSLSISNNQLVGETYLTEELELPALRELNLSSNRITGLEPMVKYLRSPSLEKMDVSVNRINALPTGLRSAFPSLRILLAATNHIMELEPDSIAGFRIVDVSSNDISHLNPKIGLLGGPGGLERLEVMGNRFRVPRWNVLERGTEATLRWLRGRVPVAEMAAWKGDDGDEAEDGDWLS